MAGPLVYVDRSDVTPGSLADLQTAVSELVAFVEAREPRLIAYGFYIDDVGSTMTVVAVHPDSASLEFHLSIGDPEFRKVGAFIRLRAIEVFGQPSDTVLDRLHEKARMLGDATVVVRSADAGFARMPTAIEAPKRRA
jgi:hypothetical protein